MKHHLLLLGIPILVSALALIGAADYHSPNTQDVTGNGLPDAWELFYGLNPADYDAYQDPDGDNLSNLHESAKLTDPFAPDTDRDGFQDDFDAKISRAYIQWGAPQFTTDDYYDYAHPDFFLSAYKNDGEWLFDTSTTQSAWYVASKELPGVGSLSMDLDRDWLTNDLVCAVHYWGNSNASLYVDLLDTNGVAVCSDLFGNLMTGSNLEEIVRLPLPLVEFTNAAVVHLRRGIGEVTVFESQLYEDSDLDNLDSDQEAQLGTSDYRADTDGDGVSDYDEVFVYHTDPCKPDKDNDPDNDKHKKTGVIYVDQARGNDNHTGRACDVAGQDGPKKTVHKGMAAVDEDSAHTLVIKSGVYNENLDLRGKNVKVVIDGNVKL